MNKFRLILKNILFNIILTTAFLTCTMGQDKEKVADFINNTASRVINVVQSKYSNEQKQEKLNVIFHESVNIDWMGKFALGKHYSKLSKNQLEEYLVAYRGFLTNLYVSDFTQYNGEGLYIESIKAISKSQYVVNVKVGNPRNSTEQINIAYRIKDFGDKCKVRDIIVEGFSVILAQRSDFSSVISKEGISSLIEKLRDKAKVINENFKNE